MSCRKRTFFTPRRPMLFAARGRGALLIMLRPLLGCQIKAEILGFLLRYRLFLYYLWFFQNIEKDWRKYFVILIKFSSENELSHSIDLDLVQQRVQSKYFIETDSNNQNFHYSEFQNHLQIKSNLHFSFCQSQIKKKPFCPWTPCTLPPTSPV